MKEFIYQLILEDRLFVAENWTAADEQRVYDHFEHLKRLLSDGRLIVAGKTAGLDTSTYGIVLFQANDRTEAEELMKRDPAVTSGIMTATLHEYNLALFNPNYKKE